MTQYVLKRLLGLLPTLLIVAVLVFLFGTGGGAAFYSSVQAPSVPLLPDGVWPRRRRQGPS